MTRKKFQHSGYRPALERAWEELQRSNLAERVSAAGAKLTAEGAILLECFGREYSIIASEKKIVGEGGVEPDIGTAILMLHYLNTASGLPPKHKQIGFAQVPGATGYLAPFSGRVIFPLAGMFDRSFEKMDDAFGKIGGARKDFATRCYEVRAFPRVVLTVIYWRGDEEVASGGQIVFDEGITEYLPTEDIVVVCQELVSLLREALS